MTKTIETIEALHGPRGRIDALLRLLEQQEVSRAKTREVIEDLGDYLAEERDIVHCGSPYEYPEVTVDWPPIEKLDWGPTERELVDRRRELLTQSHLSEEDQAEVKSLEQQIGWVPTGHSPQEKEDMRVIHEAAEALRNGSQVPSKERQCVAICVYCGYKAFKDTAEDLTDAINLHTRRCKSNPAVWLQEDVDRLRSKAGFLKDAPHSDPDECPTYYDECNCTVENLDWQIDRAEKAEQRVKDLKAELRWADAEHQVELRKLKEEAEEEEEEQRLQSLADGAFDDYADGR